MPEKRLKPFLIGFVALSLLMTTSLAVVISVLLTRAEAYSQREHAVTDILVDQLGIAKYHIVQIQQYLTDSAATGADDGTKDARKSLTSLQENLALIEQKDPSLKADTQNILHDARRLFAIGENMVAAYNRSRAEGNQLMKGADGFDVRSDQLQKDVDHLARQIEKEQSAAVKQVEEILINIRRITIVLALLMAISSVYIGRRLYLQVFRQLGGEPSEGVALARKLAEGDLAQTVVLQSGDKTSLFAQFAAMRIRWTEVATSLNGQVWLMLSAFGQLRHQARDMSAHCDQQTDATAAIASNIEQLTSSSQEIAERSSAAAEQAARARLCSETGRQHIEAMNHEMADAKNSVSNSAQLVEQLQQHAISIGQLVDTIRKISEQTNLLALNAAIEAARAGESGRGFAVVADEVRTLAGNTEAATSQISGLVEAIQRSSSEIVSSFEENARHVGAGLELSSLVKASMLDISQESARAGGQIDSISNALIEQQKSMVNIRERITDISDMSCRNADAATGIASAAEKLDQIAQAVQQEISYFKFAKQNDEDGMLF